MALDLLHDETFVHAATARSPLDVLINNAAVAPFDTSMRAPTADIRMAFKGNVFGTLAHPRCDGSHAGRRARRQRHVAAGALRHSEMAGYAATEHALHALTTAMPELSGRDIAVRGVCPGGIDADMLAEFAGPKAHPRSAAEALLGGRRAAETRSTPIRKAAPARQLLAARAQHGSGVAPRSPG